MHDPYPIEEETKKYAQCYALENYHLQGQRLQRVTKDILRMAEGASYLDVGCGRGEMVKLAKSRGVFAVGLELVPSLCDGETIHHGSVLDLPWRDDAFHYVSCYDMIEHLPPEHVDRALDELFRVCRNTLYLTTNDKRSHLGDLELHLTRMPRAWWDAKLIERAGDPDRIVRDTYGHNMDEWHWSVHLE